MHNVVTPRRAGARGSAAPRRLRALFAKHASPCTDSGGLNEMRFETEGWLCVKHDGIDVEEEKQGKRQKQRELERQAGRNITTGRDGNRSGERNEAEEISKDREGKSVSFEL